MTYEFDDVNAPGVTAGNIAIVYDSFASSSRRSQSPRSGIPSARDGGGHGQTSSAKA